MSKPICRKCGKPMELKVERLPDGRVMADYRCSTCGGTVSEVRDELLKAIEEFVKDLEEVLASSFSLPQVEVFKVNCPVCGAEDETTVHKLILKFKCGHKVELTIDEMFELLRKREGA